MLYSLAILSVFSISSAYSVDYLPLFDEDTYSIGEFATITVEDDSKNTLSGAVNSFFIQIESDSEPLSKQLELVETGLDTGIFTGSIQLSSKKGDDTLYVRDGDSIHAMYLSFIKTATIKSNSDVFPILISTDQNDYKIGEVIVVSGSVTGGDTRYDVIMNVKDPHGNIIHTEEIDLTYIRSFSTEINTEKTGWIDSGNYKVLIWHESPDNYAETAFSFSSTFSKDKTGNSIRVFNSDINLDYSVSSGKITLVRADTEKNSLVFSLGTTSGGHLTVELPRYIIDSQDDKGDSEFLVLMDDRNTAYIEKTNPNERTLTIQYESDTKRLEVIGTFLDLTPQPATKTTFIPEWVRNNAEWWSKDLIGEDDFVSGVQYLINQGVIQIPIAPNEIGVDTSEFVPTWVKDNARWWSEGLVSDAEFVNGLQYLVGQGIISV